MFRKLMLLATAGMLAIGPAVAADKVKIGFVTTITTPAGVIGKDMVDAVNLAVKDIGGKMAGLEVDLIIEDDPKKFADALVNLCHDSDKRETLRKNAFLKIKTQFGWGNIVDNLESGNVDLEKSIENYTRGSLLRSHCQAKLDEAVLKLEEIKVSSDGKISKK